MVLVFEGVQCRISGVESLFSLELHKVTDLKIPGGGFSRKIGTEKYIINYPPLCLALFWCMSVSGRNNPQHMPFVARRHMNKICYGILFSK